METFALLVNSAIFAGTPILFGALGEILTQKSGNLNLGVEGMMFMGAVSGLSAVMLIEHLAGANMDPTVAVLVAILASFIAGAFGALIYSVIVISMRAQQNVTGIALTIFGTGFGNFFGNFMGRYSPDGFVVRISDDARRGFQAINIPFLSDVPVLGSLITHNILVYFAILLAIIMAIIFKRTRIGLNLRAVGENPATADAAGINVTRYKYLATCIGGGICGIGGMYISMVRTSGVWVHNSVRSFGWIAVAMVIFATWNPRRAIIGALIFGGLTIIRMYLPTGFGIPTQLYESLPVLVTIFVLIVTSMRRIKEHSPPSSLSTNFFREER